MRAAIALVRAREVDLLETADLGQRLLDAAVVGELGDDGGFRGELRQLDGDAVDVGHDLAARGNLGDRAGQEVVLSGSGLELDALFVLGVGCLCVGRREGGCRHHADCENAREGRAHCLLPVKGVFASCHFSSYWNQPIRVFMTASFPLSG